MIKSECSGNRVIGYIQGVSKQLSALSLSLVIEDVVRVEKLARGGSQDRVYVDRVSYTFLEDINIH